MPTQSFESFRQLVLDNPDIQDQLREISDVDLFMTALIRIAAERGHTITREEADAALRAGKASWLQRSAWW